MNVWLLTVGEPLPSDGGLPRMLRAGILFDMLCDHGHTVDWWTSSFNHQLKEPRSANYQRIVHRPGGVIHLLPGRRYRSTVSFARIGNHRDNARAFERLAHEQARRPDIIVCSYPTLELCEAAIAFGQSTSTPVVVDVRDLWPDIFRELIPDWAWPLARLLLAPMYWQSRRVMVRASAITGITADFVRWGVTRGGRQETSLDRAFAMAYVEQPPSAQALSQAHAAWRQLGVDPQHFNFAFFGTVGRQFDLSTVVQAARLIRDPRIRFVLCGTGDKLDRYRAEAAGLDNVLFPGWVDAPMIRELMSMSWAGLAPYNLSDNFNSNIPNKIVEYLAGGLPIITTLTGIPRQLIDEFECGAGYTHGDPNSLASEITNLVSNPQRQRGMSERSLALYRLRFDASRVYGEMIDHFAHIIERHAAASDGRFAGTESTVRRS